MTGFRVECSAQYCHHYRRVELDALDLPDDTVFLDIPKLRRFVCERRGGREKFVYYQCVFMLRPVDGLRPVRAARFLTCKIPIPVI